MIQEWFLSSPMIRKVNLGKKGDLRGHGTHNAVLETSKSHEELPKV